ncbi:hypothetical protein NE237_024709 [Protea cynaroides]|uniref:Glycosyltransferase n=1 Tax=Protea cynaroides TaxID=273540 RepID=A0A9Q0H124_9MAGN|nr:hypothetical protein NE237_024709 [Protea cynaroides]
MEKEEGAHHAHVLVVTIPSQGHINPMLHFSKRLHSKGLRVTLAISKSLAKSMHAQTGPIRVETFSDGCENGFQKEDNGFQKEDKFGDYFERFKVVGSESITDLIKKQESLGDPITCVLYDSIFPWALDVAKKLGLIAAAFFTQSCAVSFVYYHVQQGLLTAPVTAGPINSIPGLPLLGIADLPSFVSVNDGPYASMLTLVVSQFCNIDKADWILFNSFDKLEQEVVNWMAKLWPVKMIGPTVSSIYHNQQVEGDTDYSLNLFKPVADTCMNWLNMRETGSVLYVSFGSVAELRDEQMKELAYALKESNNHFMWVVRQSEENKLPSNFVEETVEKGLVVSWCPQLEVLSHKAVGCFVTHCGWNSTLESLSLGVPMVALPQWTDQPTNAKYIEDIWGMGLRAKVDENGVALREEIHACIREVMEGEKGKEIKNNAIKWKELAKEAVDEGGSSNKNIEEFVAIKLNHVVLYVLQQVVNWMAKLWPVKTIGPTMSSIYHNQQVEGDTDYNLHLFKPVADTCMNWLNMRETGSVVYVSFGSLAELRDEQMKELASALKESNNHFMWVVRQSEENKLPSNFVEETVEKGLVVSWCPQLEVLSHKAVGCFVTHCGWNSTLESLSLGVPMVALPHFSDQPTNAKYIEDIWGMGLRAKVDENGVAIREEIQECIREVMEGEKGKEIKNNAVKWKQLAKEAVDEGGSSNKNIEEFVAS